MKKLSRQRQWQLKQIKLGKCPHCGGEVVEGYKSCKQNILANRKRQRIRLGCNVRKRVEE